MMKLHLIPVFVVLAATAHADTPKPVQAVAAKIDIAVTRSGFEPANITVPASKPVTLVFTRKTDQTCTKSVVLSLDGGKKIEKDLPLDTPVQIDVTFPKAGKLSYACSMNMAKGVIVVR
jgi:plastocyanin domain-containing protein